MLCLISGVGVDFTVTLTLNYFELNIEERLMRNIDNVNSHPLSASSSTSQATGFTQASRVHKQGTGHRGLRNFHTARMG